MKAKREMSTQRDELQGLWRLSSAEEKKEELRKLIEDRKAHRLSYDQLEQRLRDLYKPVGAGPTGKGEKRIKGSQGSHKMSVETKRTTWAGVYDRRWTTGEFKAFMNRKIERYRAKERRLPEAEKKNFEAYMRFLDQYLQRANQYVFDFGTKAPLLITEGRLGNPEFDIPEEERKRVQKARERRIERERAERKAGRDQQNALEKERDEKHRALAGKRKRVDAPGSDSDEADVPLRELEEDDLPIAAVYERKRGRRPPRFLAGPGPRNIYEGSVFAIRKPAIRRLARRAGVKRINGLIYDEVRGNLTVFLTAILKSAVIYAEHARRRTITAQDVVMALKRHGRTLYGFDPEGGRRRIR
jgi:histone H4